MTSKFIKFIQEYRYKMAPLPMLVAIGTIFFRQEIWFNGVGLGLIIASLTLHGIYPLDDYMEGKRTDLPKTAIWMIIASFVVVPIIVAIAQVLWLTPSATLLDVLFSVGELPLCLAFMMLGFYMTETTEYLGRNPLTERIENVGDLLFYGGPVFFIGHTWSLLIPALLLCIGIDSIHKIAHNETSNETISWICYFLFPLTAPLFYNMTEIMAIALLSIPVFGLYAYIRPQYTKWLAVHSISFALILLFVVILSVLGIQTPLWFEAVPDVPIPDKLLPWF